MLIFSKSGVITPANDKTNISHSFSVPSGVKKLVVKYSYNPKTVDDKADALGIVNKALSKYSASFLNPEKMLPVKNLTTLSFDENGKYRGACHRQPNEQTVVIAENNSTPGVFNRAVEEGEWNIVLNVHYVGCDVNYEIEIEGEDE